MILVNVYDAAREGDWNAFQRFFDGNTNQINPDSKFNLLQLAVTSTENPEGRLSIIRFLLEHGIDLNYRDKKFQRNALHVAFFGFRKGNLEYLKKQTELLISAGVDVNAVDTFDAIPLKYAITISKHTTEEMREIYEMLIRSGSNYKKEDAFHKSCLDYAQEYSWRNGVIDIAKDMKV